MILVKHHYVLSSETLKSILDFIEEHQYISINDFVQKDHTATLVKSKLESELKVQNNPTPGFSCCQGD